jgi:catechol 2,3-dioxygenase-like lactoylglutathione lyase family enzyme
MRAAFIDHITIRVRNLEASRGFYEAAVTAFGGRAIELDTGEISFGPEGSEDLAIAPGEPSEPIHIAFAAPDLATVDRFYEAALGRRRPRQRWAGSATPVPRGLLRRVRARPDS